ncbi:23S rRNA (adenine(2503)-C(2))-methyltransferase [Candidatus Epulonipiscium fishelsonii]|uniref:23S rRNA (Adenine(2503)-C(2))-methyltransferase n=1 Tax=Candidatus Epulonipiscium fishelsonii TaxID=77094 RepID=A0ACC8XJB5_9FIRM|nr:23S rRNA (adenine(2503)-C(2))-methyltransferase [Epulopiscium sp. SCG-D08WGA-EpuloA1]
MNIAELEQIMLSLGESKFRAQQLFEWFHLKKIWDYNQMDNLSRNLKDKLITQYPIDDIKIVKKYISAIDGTRKYLFELSDCHVIESVLIKYKHGNSVCISSQVGCNMGCKFCASTIGGLKRNLIPAEMLAQVYKISEDINEKISNVVIMGTGEPLERLDITTKFIELINSHKGQNIGPRHITISTCGLVPQILELADTAIQVTLAVSLHATTDESRKQIMPIANKYSINQLLDACKTYINKTGKRISFEYSLIDGQNDTQDDAIQLSNLLNGMLCHVNLIPVNKIETQFFESSSKNRIKDFADILKNRGIKTTIRRTLGQDINASCGQLRYNYLSV